VPLRAFNFVSFKRGFMQKGFIRLESLPPPPRIKRAVDRNSSNGPKAGKNTLIFKPMASFFDKKAPFNGIRFFVGHYGIFRRTECKMSLPAASGWVL
jgi:hypothetical protein